MGKSDKLNVMTHFAEFIESLQGNEIDLIEISRHTPLVSLPESNCGIEVFSELEGRTAKIDIKGLKFTLEIELRKYLKEFFSI